MSRTLKIFITLFLVAVLAVTLIACKDKEEYTLALAYPDIPLVFREGEVDLSSIIFEVIDKDGNIESRHKAELSMLSSEDRQKLNNSGIVAVTINYKDAKLNVSLRINPTDESMFYQLTFDAGEGYFPQDITGSGGGKTYVVNTEELAAAGKNRLTQLPPEPRRAGYEFRGWYRTVDFSDSPIGAPYYIGYNHTLYARWADAHKVTVTFGTNYIPEIQTLTVEYDSDILAPQAPQREGEIFVGWKYKDEHYLPGATIPSITEGGFILGEYRNIEVRIVFKSEAWDVDRVYTVAYNTDFTDEPTVPQIPGKTARWIVQVSPTRKEVPVYTNLIKDLVVEAEYTSILYQVNFYRFPDPWDISDRTNAVLHITREQEYNTRVSPIPQFTGDLAVPGGVGEWVYLPPDGTYTPAKQILEQGVTQDLDIYARYTPIYYRVTFDFSHFYSDQNARIVREYRYGTVLEPRMFPEDLPIPDAKEYSLRWWSRGASDFNDNQYEVNFPLTELTANRILYANITRNPRAVDFRIFPEDNEGNPVVGVDLDLGRKMLPIDTNLATHAPVLNHPKYEFTGAWTYVNGETVEDFNSLKSFKEYNTNPELDKALYVRLKIREYKVNYYNVEVQPGDLIEPYKFVFIEVHSELVRYEMTIKDPPSGEYELAPYGGMLDTPSYPGGEGGDFRFEGWYTTTNYNSAKINFASGYQIKEATNFYAKWLDAEVGTEGLVFKPLYDLEDESIVTSYYLAGFGPLVEHYDEIYIPRYYNDKPVTAISSTAFNNPDTINPLGITVVAIKLTNNIKQIEEGAFMWLNGLERFTFADDQEQNPSHYLAIYDGVLYSLDGELICYSSGRKDSSFEIPRGIPVNGGELVITRIAEAAFATNDHLTHVTFAENSQVGEISAYAFAYCQHLESISIPDSLVAINEYAFDSSARLAHIDYTANSNLLYVERNAFRDTAWLAQDKSMIVLAGVLVRYSGTDEELVMDDDIVALADEAFYHPAETLAVKSITFTENSNLQYIGSKAFEPCTLLATIYLLSNYAVDFKNDSFEGVKGATFFVKAEYRDYYVQELDLDEEEEDRVIAWE